MSLEKVDLPPFFENPLPTYMKKNTNTQFRRLTRFFMIAAGSTGNHGTKLDSAFSLRSLEKPPFFENRILGVHEKECPHPVSSADSLLHDRSGFFGTSTGNCFAKIWHFLCDGLRR